MRWCRASLFTVYIFDVHRASTKSSWATRGCWTVWACRARRLTLIFTHTFSGFWFASQFFGDDKDHTIHLRWTRHAHHDFIFNVHVIACARSCMLACHPRRIRTRHLRRMRSSQALIRMRAIVFHGAHGERREERRGAQSHEKRK